MEANGGIWQVLRDRQNAQGRRLDTVENAVRHQADQTLHERETAGEWRTNVEGRLSRLETTVKLVGLFVAIVTPTLTALMVAFLR